MDFFSTSEPIKQIVTSLQLTRSLYVSSIVIGEPYIGKKSLIKQIFPDIPMISAKEPNEVERLLQESDEIIITDFEHFPNPKSLQFEHKRILATANRIANQELIDELFAFIYTMPPLRERPDDIRHLQTRYVQEACQVFDVDATGIDPKSIVLDLSQNTRSLRRSVYFGIAAQAMPTELIEAAIYHHAMRRLEGNNGYKEHIGLFERPLIKAGLDKYGSQLKLADVLGINRNTLRKKIREHDID